MQCLPVSMTDTFFPNFMISHIHFNISYFCPEPETDISSETVK